MTQQPWWTTGLVTAIATFVAVVIAQGGLILVERIRARREDARRWHTERRRLYAEVVHYFADLIVAGFERDGLFDKSEFDSLNKKLAHALYEAALIAGPNVNSQLHAVKNYVSQLRDWIQSIRPSDGRKELVDTSDVIFNALVRAARSELGAASKSPRRPQEGLPSRPGTQTDPTAPDEALG